MEGMNLLMMDGYISSPKITNNQDGSIMRYGFLIVWEAPVFQNGQRAVNPDGSFAIKDVRFSCQAWGPIAQAMAQLPVGTPIRIKANANRWNAARQGEPSNWVTDFRVNQFEVL